MYVHFYLSSRIGIDIHDWSFTIPLSRTGNRFLSCMLFGRWLRLRSRFGRWRHCRVSWAIPTANPAWEVADVFDDNAGKNHWRFEHCREGSASGRPRMWRATFSRTNLLESQMLRDTWFVFSHIGTPAIDLMHRAIHGPILLLHGRVRMVGLSGLGLVPGSWTEVGPRGHWE